MCLKALQILQSNSGKHLVFLKSNKISSQAKKEKKQAANAVKCEADGMDKESAWFSGLSLWSCFSTVFLED